MDGGRNAEPLKMCRGSLQHLGLVGLVAVDDVGHGRGCVEEFIERVRVDHLFFVRVDRHSRGHELELEGVEHVALFGLAHDIVAGRGEPHNGPLATDFAVLVQEQVVCFVDEYQVLLGNVEKGVAFVVFGQCRNLLRLKFALVLHAISQPVYHLTFEGHEVWVRVDDGDPGELLLQEAHEQPSDGRFTKTRWHTEHDSVLDGGSRPAKIYKFCHGQSNRPLAVIRRPAAEQHDVDYKRESGVHRRGLGHERPQLCEHRHVPRLFYADFNLVNALLNCSTVLENRCNLSSFLLVLGTLLLRTSDLDPARALQSLFPAQISGDDVVHCCLELVEPPHKRVICYLIVHLISKFVNGFH